MLWLDYYKIQEFPVVHGYKFWSVPKMFISITPIRNLGDHMKWGIERMITIWCLVVLR